MLFWPDQQHQTIHSKFQFLSVSLHTHQSFPSHTTTPSLVGLVSVSLFAFHPPPPSCQEFQIPIGTLLLCPILPSPTGTLLAGLGPVNPVGRDGSGSGVAIRSFFFFCFVVAIHGTSWQPLYGYQVRHDANASSHFYTHTRLRSRRSSAFYPPRHLAVYVQ
ncbi:hypothetical protein LY76DRAFT_333148 [Colletotrichum caudatum]|nr:hypothetical protein LY76DRAFT_333148 [Colletotrichum caudatum]